MAARRNDIIVSYFAGGSSLGSILGPVLYQSTAQLQNIEIVCATDRTSSEVPACVVDYVSSVVHAYDDPTFKSHFRLQRSTFEV